MRTQLAWVKALSSKSPKWAGYQPSDLDHIRAVGVEGRYFHSRLPYKPPGPGPIQGGPSLLSTMHSRRCSRSPKYQLGPCPPQEKGQRLTPGVRGGKCFSYSWPLKAPIHAARSHLAPASLRTSNISSPTQRGGKSKSWVVRSVASRTPKRWGQVRDQVVEPAVMRSVQ